MSSLQFLMERAISLKKQIYKLEQENTLTSEHYAASYKSQLSIVKDQLDKLIITGHTVTRVVVKDKGLLKEYYFINEKEEIIRLYFQLVKGLEITTLDIYKNGRWNLVD